MYLSLPWALGILCHLSVQVFQVTPQWLHELFEDKFNSCHMDCPHRLHSDFFSSVFTFDVVH